MLARPKLNYFAILMMTTVCPKVPFNFDMPGICLLCWPILKTFGMLNYHTLRFVLVYNNPCHVLLTQHEQGKTFEEILKEQKRWKFWHFGFFKLFIDSCTPWILGKLWFMTLRCSPIDKCSTWERENEEKLTLNTSQAEPVVANSTAVRQFISILSLSLMPCSFQESIEILKNPYLSEISPFLLLQNFFKHYAMLMLGHE